MPHVSVCWPSWGQLRHSSEHPSLHSACTTVGHKGFKRVEAQFERAEQSWGTSRCQGVRSKSSFSIPSPAVTTVPVSLSPSAWEQPVLKQLWRLEGGWLRADSHPVHPPSPQVREPSWHRFCQCNTPGLLAGHVALCQPMTPNKM